MIRCVRHQHHRRTCTNERAQNQRGKTGHRRRPNATRSQNSRRDYLRYERPTQGRVYAALRSLGGWHGTHLCLPFYYTCCVRRSGRNGEKKPQRTKGGGGSVRRAGEVGPPLPGQESVPPRCYSSPGAHSNRALRARSHQLCVDGVATVAPAPFSVAIHVKEFERGGGRSAVQRRRGFTQTPTERGEREEPLNK